MSATRSVLANRYTVWALTAAISVFGVLAYLRLPMQLFPDTAPPLVNVVTAFPGAAAEDVAENLSRVLEDEFTSLEGVVRVKSSSQDNLSLVSVEFDYNRPVELAAVDTQNAIAAIRGQLPAGIREPQVLKFSTNDRPVITFGITGDDLIAARTFAEDTLAPALQRVSGVAAVDVFGGSARAVLVEVEAAALEAYRVPYFKITEALQKHNAALPAGTLRSEQTQLMFRVETRARDLAQLAAIPLTAADGSRVLLGDLAQIRRGALDNDAAFSIDGRPAIALQVFKTTEANTVEIVEASEAVARQVIEGAHGLSLLVGEESATFTRVSITGLLENIWQALLLAAFLIFLFLARWGTSLVATASMVLSYGATFALMHVTGVELNMVTLTAIILAVGMVVDASVVVIENAETWRKERGLSPLEAVVRGTDEVRLPVLAGAATTLAVLVPLQFMPGFVGKTFGPLARTLMFAFSSSLVVALYVVPVLTMLTVDRSKGDRLAERFTAPFHRLMDGVRRFYVQVLRLALRRRAVTIALTMLLFALSLAGLRFRGAEVLPRMDSGSFYVTLETPPGSSLEETARVVADVEAVVRAESSVVKVQSQAGFEAGMRSFGSSGVQGPTQGFITVTLTPRTERTETIWQIEQRVRDKLARIPGIHAVSVKELGNTAKATTTAPIIVRLSGEDPRVLDDLGDRILDTLKTIPAVVEPRRTWRFDLERTRVEVDEQRAGHLGMSPASVAAQMQAGANGLPAGEFYGDDGSPQPIWVRYARRDRPQADDLLSYPLWIPGSPDPIPLRAIASLKHTKGQGLVTREDASANLEIAAYTGPKPLNFTVADVKSALATMTMPKDYRLEVAGENNDMGEAGLSLATALVAAILAVYLLLVAQLRSFLHPFTILMTVPLSLIGVSAALWMGGKYLSMPVAVGIILLVGTVVNNAIILLDFIEQRRREGAERQPALLESVEARFRPIMITSLSTIVGMIPLAAEWALGAERFAPLATAVIGGMTAATFLTLIFIPVLYDLFDEIAARFTNSNLHSVDDHETI